MKAEDPSYPLYPVATIICSASLAFVLLTNFIRQRWNTGVSLLCIYLFLENLLEGINSIIWASNEDIKLLVYCDIGELPSQLCNPCSRGSFYKFCLVSHFYLFVFIAKPACTLVITRHLHKIASMRILEGSSRRQVPATGPPDTQWSDVCIHTATSRLNYRYSPHGFPASSRRWTSLCVSLMVLPWSCDAISL